MKIEIELNEEDLRRAIEDYIYCESHLHIKEIRFSTGIKGSYDTGDAVEYVKNVWCDVDLEEDDTDSKIADYLNSILS